MPEAPLAPCLATQAPAPLGGMALPRPGVGDEEGARVDPDLKYVVDAHVHLFPPGLFEALWRWFDTHGWPVRYRLHAKDTVRFLLDRGVGHIVALHYAHKPGMARALNAFVADIAKDEPRVVGLGTVFPGEPGASAIVDEAFALGLHGIKLHCHVQAVAADAPELHDIYATCQRANRPVVIHAGREPRSHAYPKDPHELCNAMRLESVLRSFPSLRLCVPHLGADEFAAYGKLLERYDNLWLDTTMVLADYFDLETPRWLLDVRPARILYGSDFPNLPYAWDRELVRIKRARLDDARLEMLLSGAARSLYGIA